MPPHVCRICLATGVRMATIGALQPVYEKLTGIALHIDQRPMVACYICHALLTKAQRLMFQAITAEKALQALLNVCAVITETSVSAVDRSAAGLCPLLSVSKLEYLDNIQLASGAEVKTENCDNHVNGVSENNLEEESMAPSASCTADAVMSAAVALAPNLDTEQPLNNHANGELEDYEGSEHNGSVSAAVASDVKSESDGEAADSSINPRAEMVGSVSAAAASDVVSESDGEVADSSINPRAEMEDMDAQGSEDTQELNQCVLCLRGFLRTNSLRKHLNAHAVRSLRCQCGQRFKYRIQLQRHLSRCRTQLVKCADCQRFFPNEFLLDRHKYIQWCENKGQSQNPVQTHKKNYCDLCQRQFSDKNCLNRHTRAKHTIDPFRCNICQHQCNNIQGFRMHLKTHIDLCKCNICQREFTSHTMLERHMSHHPVNKRTNFKTESYKCRVCDREFLLKRSLGLHFRMHKAKSDPERVAKRYHQCHICPYRSDVLGNVKKHLKTHLIQKVACAVCNLRVSSKEALRYHIKLHKDLEIHTAEPDSKRVKERIYQCHICPYRSKHSKNVNAHLKTHFIQKVTCKFCGLRVSSKVALGHHMKFHKDSEMRDEIRTAEPDSNKVEKRIYQCHICPYRSIHPQSVRAHRKTHLIQKVACTVCDLRVSSREALRHHMKLHKEHTAEPDSNRGEKRYFQCHICPYRSNRSGNVKVHLKTHSIQKVACALCDLRVSNKVALRHHMKLHKDGFYCAACRRSFATRDALQTHMSSHEPEEETEEQVAATSGDKLQCSLCPMRFNLKIAFRRHVISEHL